MCLVCLETISVMKDFNLSRHYYNCTEYNVVALNVGPLFFSFVPSLNDDVCEP